MVHRLNREPKAAEHGSKELDRLVRGEVCRNSIE
jgi:hypothetical protein